MNASFYHRCVARSRGNLAGVDPRLVDLFDQMLSVCMPDFLPVCVEGKRTDKRQAEMYRAGLSWTKRSRHQDGRAIDVVLFRADPDSDLGFAVSYDLRDYQVLRSRLTPFLRRHAFVWGGQWKQVDAIHWELPPDPLPIGQVPPEGGEGGAKP